MGLKSETKTIFRLKLRLVNNYRYWADENPLEIVEKPKHLQSHCLVHGTHYLVRSSDLTRSDFFLVNRPATIKELKNEMIRVE